MKKIILAGIAAVLLCGGCEAGTGKGAGYQPDVQNGCSGLQ